MRDLGSRSVQETSSMSGKIPTPALAVTPKELPFAAGKRARACMQDVVKFTTSRMHPCSCMHVVGPRPFFMQLCGSLTQSFHNQHWTGFALPDTQWKKEGQASDCPIHCMLSHLCLFFKNLFEHERRENGFLTICSYLQSALRILHCFLFVGHTSCNAEQRQSRS